MSNAINLIVSSILQKHNGVIKISNSHASPFFNDTQCLQITSFRNPKMLTRFCCIFCNLFDVFKITLPAFILSKNQFCVIRSFFFSFLFLSFLHFSGKNEKKNKTNKRKREKMIKMNKTFQRAKNIRQLFPNISGNFLFSVSLFPFCV